MVKKSNTYKTVTVSGLDTVQLPMDFADYLFNRGIESESIKFKIEYNIWGKDIPATYLQPAESAELEIPSVEFVDKSNKEIELLKSLPKDIYEGLLKWFQDGSSEIVNKAISDAEEVPEPDEDEVRYRKYGIEK